jgi:hypothetical protein
MMRSGFGIVPIMFSITAIMMFIALMGSNQDLNLLTSQKVKALEVSHEASKVGAVAGMNQMNTLAQEGTLSQKEIQIKALAATIKVTCDTLAKMKLISGASGDYSNSVEENYCVVVRTTEDACLSDNSEVACATACQNNPSSNGEVVLTKSITCN